MWLHPWERKPLTLGFSCDPRSCVFLTWPLYGAHQVPGSSSPHPAGTAESLGSANRGPRSDSVMENGLPLGCGACRDAAWVVWLN